MSEKIKAERDDLLKANQLLHALIRNRGTEIDRLAGALEQIAIVCTDNMDRDCDHRMALDFVRQVANDALDPVGALPPRASSSQPAESAGAKTGGGK